MTKLDQFESVFKSADKAVYSYDRPTLDRVLVITDLNEADAAGLELASDSPFWWAVVFGANLGGNITPIGSASTLVAVTIIYKNKLPLSFVSFVKAAAPFAALQLVLASGYVLAVLG